MKRLLFSVAILLSLAVSAAAQTTLTLPGKYIPGRPGAGVDCSAGACLGGVTDVIAVVGGIRVSKTDANNASQDTDIMISGMGGGSADGVAESVDLRVNGSNLVVTVGRTLGLDDLVGSVALDVGSALTVNDETTELTDQLDELTFTGAGVTCADTGGEHVTCTIPGGGGGTADGHLTAATLAGEAATFTVADGTPGTVTLDLSTLPRTDTEIDARIADWAEQGNTEIVPASKLGTGTPGTGVFLRGDSVWATPAGGGQALTTMIQQTTAGASLSIPAAQLTAATGATDDDFHAPHGLGRKPDFVHAYLENTTAELGYAVGDRFLWPTSQRLLVGFDDTDVFVSTENRLPFIVVKGGGGESGITAGSWMLEAVPYVFEDVSITGLEGMTGPAGADGAAGAAGADGTDGTDGTDGADGADGSDSPADGVVTAGSVAGTTLTLTRSVGGDVTITGLPTGGGGVTDGVVTGLSTVGHELTATRSIGLPVSTTLPYEVILPDSTGNLRAFTAADVNRIANDHGNLCTVRGQVLNPATLLSVTTEAYTATGYRGTFYESGDVGQPLGNDTMFAYHNRRWYQWVAVLQTWAITSGPTGWRGAFDTRDAAYQAVTAVGQTYYADNVRPRQVRRVTAYTAPAPADIEYSCLPEPAILALQNRANEGVYAVPPDDVTQAGDIVTLANLPPLSDGLLLYFTAEGANTGPLTLSIGSSTYTVFKAAPSGGAELFTGGEIENGLPLQLVYDEGEGTFYWFGTVLGSAARRDVGTDQNDLVALGANGRVASTLLGPGPTVGDVLKIGATGPDWLPEESGQTQAETDARYILKSGDTMEGNFVVEHTNGTAILARVPTANQTAYQGQRMGETFSFFSLSGDAGGTNERPGIQFGIGGTASRDVALHRGGADLLQTPDAFHARTLDVDAAGLAETKTNLEIPTNAAGVPTDVTSFDGPLSATDTDVQRALDVLDNAVDDNSRRVVLSEAFLEYQINEGADQFYPTTFFTWNGNLYLATANIAVHRFRVRAHPTQAVHGDRDYYGGAWKVTRADDLITFPPEFGTYVRGRIRHGQSGPFTTGTVTVTFDTDAELEVQFDTAFRVQAGEYFVMAVHQQDGGNDTLHSLPGINETSHAGDTGYPHETIEFTARAREGDPNPDQGINSYLGPPTLGAQVIPAFMEMDYGVLDAGVSTIRDEGTQIYHGLTHINFEGAGVTGTHDAANDWANIAIPGVQGFDLSSLNVIPDTELALEDLILVRDTSESENRRLAVSRLMADLPLWSLPGTTDIVPTDRIILHDSSASLNRTVTWQDLAARLADGTTILATDGTLTAVGGGGGGAVADGVVNSATLGVVGADLSLTLDRSTGADVTASATLPVVAGGSYTTGTLTLTKPTGAGAPVVIPGVQPFAGVPAHTGAVDDDDDFLLWNTGIGAMRTLTGAQMTTLYGGGGVADGVVDSLAMLNGTLTLGRSVGADLTLANVPFGGLSQDTGALNDGDRFVFLDTNPLGVRYRTTTQMRADFGGGLATVATESPVSGDGSTGDPVTVADGTINLVHLANGARYHRGNWNSLQVYVRSQSVEHDGHLWVNALGSSLGDTPSMTSTVWYRIDHRPTEVQDQGTVLTENANLINFTGTGVTATATGYDVTVNIPGSGLNIAGLPNQASTQLADTDVMVIENVSESNIQRHLTMGSLSAFLADGTTITSAGGKLTAVGGGGGTTVEANPTGDPTDIIHTIDVAGTIYDFPNATVAFKAALDEVLLTNLTATWLNMMQVATADIQINEGTFTVEAQTDTTERICVPQAGIYSVESNVYIRQNTPYGRGHPAVRFAIDGVGQPEKAVQYQRGITSQSFSSVELTSLYDLAAGSCIAVQMREEGGDTTRDYTVIADASYFETVLEEGIQGPPGLDGGGGGIRIEEGGNVRVASANALDFNINDFAINIVQDPEAGISIAAALTRDTEVASAFDAVTVADRDFTFTQIDGGAQVVSVPLIDIADYPDRVANLTVQDSFLVADFDNSNTVRHTTGFDLREFIQDTLTGDGVVDGGSVAGTTLTLTRTVGADVTITGLPEGGGDSFSIHDLPEQTQLLATTDRIPLSDESANGDPNEYMTAFNFFGSIRDVIGTSRATPLDNDRMYVTREDVTGDPLGYITVDQLRTSIGGFSLHDDVSDALVTPDQNDRMLVTDESETGDPNEYITIRNLLSSFRDITNVTGGANSTPEDRDRILISDESQLFDPMEYITVGELATAIVTESRIEDVLFTDVEAVPDITVGNNQGNLLMATGFTGWTGKTLLTFSLGYHENTGVNAREIAVVTFFIADLIAVPQTATAGTAAVTSPGTAQNAIALAYHDREAIGNSETTDASGVLIISFARTGAGELLVATDSTSSAFLSAKAVAY